MEAARCAACGAVLAPGAPWCSLCLAHVAGPEPVVATAAPFVGAIARNPLYPPVVIAPPPGSESQDADVATGPAVTYPCLTCGEQVPLTADACPGCGAGFLADAVSATPTLKIPGVGDLADRSTGTVYLIAGGIGLTAAIIVVAIVALLAAVL